MNGGVERLNVRTENAVVAKTGKTGFFAAARSGIVLKRRVNGRQASLDKRDAGGFTLVELILVMALIVIAVSFITPHLANFFKGRTLNSEARQLIALTHQGQSRAISGGVPMVLWIDTQKKSYGLEEEPGYSDKDPDAVEFQIDDSLKFDIPDSGAISPMVTQVDSVRAGLPQIIFLPDATIDETSPHTVRITGNNNESITITQTRDRNGYEIASTTSQ